MEDDDDARGGGGTEEKKKQVTFTGRRSSSIRLILIDKTYEYCTIIFPKYRAFTTEFLAQNYRIIDEFYLKFIEP